MDSRGTVYHNQVYIIDRPNSRHQVPWRANNFHPGGVHLVKGDNSVQLVPDDVARAVFETMATIAGNVTVGDALD